MNRCVVVMSALSRRRTFAKFFPTIIQNSFIVSICFKIFSCFSVVLMALNSAAGKKARAGSLTAGHQQVLV